MKTIDVPTWDEGTHAEATFTLLADRVVGWQKYPHWVPRGLEATQVWLVGGGYLPVLLPVGEFARRFGQLELKF